MAILNELTDKKLKIHEVSFNFDQARSARFSYFVRYDETSPPYDLNQRVVILSGGTTLFNGWIISMRRIADGTGEKIEYEAVGPRYFLGQLVYVRHNSATISYNVESNSLTCGQIFLELMETVPKEFVRKFSTSEILAMTLKPGRVDFRDTTYEQAFSTLCDQAGPFRWYVTPNRELRVVDLRAVTGTNFYIGQLGQKLSDHSEYDVINHEFNYSLVGRFSRITAFGERDEYEDTQADQDYEDFYFNETRSLADILGSSFYSFARPSGDWGMQFNVSKTMRRSVKLSSSLDLSNISQTIDEELNLPGNKDRYRKWWFYLPVNLVLTSGIFLWVMKRLYKPDLAANLVANYDPDQEYSPSQLLKAWKQDFEQTWETGSAIVRGPHVDDKTAGAVPFYLDDPIYEFKLLGYHNGARLTTPETFEVTIDNRIWKMKTDFEIYLDFEIAKPRRLIVLSFVKPWRWKEQEPLSDEVDTPAQRYIKNLLIEKPNEIVSLGPEGTAYSDYAWDLKLYKTIDRTAETEDLTTIAQRELDKVKDVTINGRITLWGIKSALTLNNGANIQNSNFSAWSSIKANIFSVQFDLEDNKTVIELSNEYWR